MLARIGIWAAGMVVTLMGCQPSARAEVPEAAERWAAHGQFTYVEQESGSFAAPYRGANSLTPDQGRQTADATLFLGARLWEGTEAWLTPELDQGFGLDNTLGLAGFSSGEAYKVGRARPYLRLARAFVRATFGGGESTEPVPAGLLQLAGRRSPDRWVVTFGKFSVTDVFDASGYAHDPRSDFLNWTAIDAGSFDYAADAWGYTIGVALERYEGDWTFRGAAFDLSSEPNSQHLQPGAHQFQVVAEIERRYSSRGHAGKVLLTGYQSRARMALLSDVFASAVPDGQPLDPAPLRRFRTRSGISLLLDQALADDLGVFARSGSASGNVEAYEFTDVDRSSSAGVWVAGHAWGRARDVVGAATIRNSISNERARFLNAGGLGILVGDGRLPHAGAERILEVYYRLAVASDSHVTLDYQRVTNPAYNRDRGPVSILALRVHTEF